MPEKKPPAKIMLVLAIVLLCLTSLSGCGQQAPEPVTITMVAGAVGKEFEVLKEQVAVIQQEVHQTMAGEQDAATATRRMAAMIQAIIDGAAEEESP